MAALLVEAVTTNQTSPSTACVSWMCSRWLVWQVWRLEDLVVWAYHSPGRPIPAWAECFSAREEESGEQWSHQVGLISWVSQHRLVFIPSTPCQAQDQQFLLAVLGVVLNTSLSRQEQDQLLSQQFYSECLNQTLPRQPKEINNTLSLEIQIKVQVAEMNTSDADVIHFTESDDLGSLEGWSQSPQNIPITAVESSLERESRNISEVEPTVGTDSLGHSKSNGDHVTQSNPL